MKYEFLTADGQEQILKARALSFEADHFRATQDVEAREAVIAPDDRETDPVWADANARLEQSEAAADQAKTALADLGE